MPLRSPPPRRAWQPAVAAFAIAMTMLAAPLRAQETAPAQEPAPPPLGLKDTDDGLAPSAQAAPNEPGFSAPASPVASPETAPDSATDDPQPPPPKKNPTAQKDKKIKLVKDLPPPSLVLQPYHNAQRAGLRGGPPALEPEQTPSPTVAALPLPPPKHRPPVDDKPFDPVGIGFGDLRLTPYVEEDGGYSSNPLLLAGQTKGSLYETTQAGLGLQSEWARSELKGSLTAGYTDYFSEPQANNPNANGTLDGRFDVSHDLSFDGEARFNIATQTTGSVTLPTGVVLSSNQRPLVETYGATLGGAQKFGDLTFSLHGTLDHTSYQNAALADGSVDDLSSDDLTDYGLKARAAYQISPVISPFVETVVDTRRYDSEFDSNGYARTSNGVLARAGATLAMTGKLTGEASLGYGERQYQDARLPDLRGPLLDASLVWLATPLTTITLKTGTSLADTTNAGDSGAVSRNYTIDVSHALWRNLTIGATAGYATDVYTGVPLHDSSTSFGLRADYNVTRDIILRATATRSEFQSSAPNSSFTANVFMLGLRLQR